MLVAARTPMLEVRASQLDPSFTAIGHLERFRPLNKIPATAPSKPMESRSKLRVQASNFDKRLRGVPEAIVSVPIGVDVDLGVSLRLLWLTAKKPFIEQYLDPLPNFASGIRRLSNTKVVFSI